MARGKKTCTPAGSRSHEGKTNRRASLAESATSDERCHQKKIFVGGLGLNTSTQRLREHFVHFGEIVDTVVLRWPDGRSRGFGYVFFADAAAANAALGEMHKIDGHEVDVKRAVPGTNKLFVGGLPQSSSAAELREYFEWFGVVSDAVIMKDPATNRSRGFGFVCFQAGQDGAAAVASCLQDCRSHQLRGKWIEVKAAAPPHKLTESQGSHEAGTRTRRRASAPEASPKLTPLCLAGATQSWPVSAPPGLEAPKHVAVPKTEQAFGRGVAFAEAPASLPLPSLLGGWRRNAGLGSLDKFEPAKLRIGSGFESAGVAKSTAGGVSFEASDALRQSLEQLLCLHTVQKEEALGEFATAADRMEWSLKLEQ